MHFFFLFEEGGYCSDLHLTHTLTHLYILHYNLVPVFSPNSPTHFSFSLVSHPFLLSFAFWLLWPRGNQQTCALCVKMCSPGFVLVWSDLVLQQICTRTENPNTGQMYDCDFIVVKDASTSLIGARTTLAMGLIRVDYESIAKTDLMAEPAKSSLTKEAILERYSDVFAERAGCREGKLHLERDQSLDLSHLCRCQFEKSLRQCKNCSRQSYETWRTEEYLPVSTCQQTGYKKQSGYQVWL